MRILLAMLLASGAMSVGCTTLCGSGCAGGKCSALTNPMNSATTTAAKPKESTTAMPSSVAKTASPKAKTQPTVVPVDAKMPKTAPVQPVVPAEHDTMMPEGEPSASLVPPPPSAARLSEEDSHLPSPKQIAKKSNEFSAMPKVPPRDEDWNESPSDEADASSAPSSKPTQWSSRTIPRPALGN